MKILFVGVLDVPYSTNIPMKEAFIAHGHEVDTFNYRTITNEHSVGSGQLVTLSDQSRRLLQNISRSKVSNLPLYGSRGIRIMNNILIDLVREKDYEFVFFSKAELVTLNIINNITELADTWYYFMDCDFTAKRIQAPLYASVCKWCSASYSSVVNLFSRESTSSYFVPQGVNTGLFTPTKKAKESDVIFVGSANSRRRSIIQELLDDGIDVVCHGSGWENESVYRDDLVEKYRESKIILNLQSFPPDKQGSGFSIRVFQAMGTGSFMLSEFCQDLGAIFQQGEHLDWFEDADECVEKVHHYLDNTEAREDIARTGANYVHENYSWERVIGEILQIVKGEDNRMKFPHT